MRRWIPDTIAARTLLALIFGLALSHAISVSLYVTDRSSALIFSGGEHIGERIATIERVIRESEEAQRQRLLELVDGPGLRVTRTTESAVDNQRAGAGRANRLSASLAAHLDHAGNRSLRMNHMGAMARRHMGAMADDTLMVSLPLPDKTWLNFAVPVDEQEPFWSLRLGLSMAVMLAVVAMVSALVVHHLTKPLATFARAAQRLGTDVRAPSIPESGPTEVRQAIQAFNEMQKRIRRFVEDRTQMLAAISHDLGTPITRLRLRAEFIEDEEQRKKMLADLEDMEKMVFSALSFARDEAASEPHATVDLRTVLQRVCDDMADAGGAVALDVGDQAVTLACRPVALRRALTNLVDNAVKYGRRARVALQDGEDRIVITIDDDGPGIPQDFLEDAFKPFQRLEASRSRETGGTGLGLTVARTVVRAHGGDITLSNREEGGLRVTITLPR